MTKQRQRRVTPPRKDAPKAEANEPTPLSAAGGYRVSLPEFEGPLDLLLHLIQQHELNILDIPIGFITEKYVAYITLMGELNIDLASEYLVMAATLAHIKSKMLLPVPPADQEDSPEEELDPRAELVRRLLEYQKYRQAADELAGRKILGRDVFPRGAPAPSVEGRAALAPIGVFKLLAAFERVLERIDQSLDHEVEFERFSITDRINQLVDVLRNRGMTPFEALFDGQHSRADLVVTFLALLEMTRIRLLRVHQSGPLEELTVELADDGLLPPAGEDWAGRWEPGDPPASDDSGREMTEGTVERGGAQGASSGEARAASEAVGEGVESERSELPDESGEPSPRADPLACEPELATERDS